MQYVISHFHITDLSGPVCQTNTVTNSGLCRMLSSHSIIFFFFFKKRETKTGSHNHLNQAIFPVLYFIHKKSRMSSGAFQLTSEADDYGYTMKILCSLPFMQSLLLRHVIFSSLLLGLDTLK